MDTCGLERVERFRINLNEKNFAPQKNTLTSSSAKMPSHWHLTAAATIRLSMYRTSVLLRKGHRIRMALARADASLFERYPAEGAPKSTVYREAQRASYLDLPMETHDREAPAVRYYRRVGKQ